MIDQLGQDQADATESEWKPHVGPQAIWVRLIPKVTPRAMHRCRPTFFYDKNAMFRISAFSKSLDLCEVQVLLRVDVVLRLFCCTVIPILRVEIEGIRAVTTHLSADGR
jgi:hypothetical protein